MNCLSSCYRDAPRANSNDFHSVFDEHHGGDADGGITRKIGKSSGIVTTGKVTSLVIDNADCAKFSGD